MKVYFVRHGQSELTETKHQLPKTPLSKLGMKQANAIAKRFNNLPIEVILSSVYTRAKQTAQKIYSIKNVPIIESELLIERKMPSEFYGKAVDDPSIIPIHNTIREHFYDSSWHYEQEENFYDLQKRAKDALALMTSQKKEHIAVVTHGYFLTFLLFLIILGDDADPKYFRMFRDHTANSNTGLTLCEYNKDTWKLLTWNDIAHLGDD